MSSKIPYFEGSNPVFSWSTHLRLPWVGVQGDRLETNSSRLDNEFSGPFAVVSGVPQGSGFTRGLPFLMIVYNVIPVSYILLSQFRI